MDNVRVDNIALVCYSLSMKVSQTTNVRIYKSTHELLKKLADNRRQQIIVVLDEIVKELSQRIKV